MSVAIENLKDKTGLHEGVEVTYTVVEEVIHETDVLKTGSNNHLISNDDTQWNSDVVAFVITLFLGWDVDQNQGVVIFDIDT